MERFNLTIAIKGCPMKTRGGLEAKFITRLKGGQPAPLVIDVNGSYENYYLNGRHGVADSDMDLFMDEM